MISVMITCEETYAIKPDTCEHVFTPYGEIGDERMTLLNPCISVKELAYVLNLNSETIQLSSVDF